MVISYEMSLLSFINFIWNTYESKILMIMFSKGSLSIVDIFFS